MPGRIVSFSDKQLMAKEDVQDISECDTIISFTEHEGSHGLMRGTRHAEFGLGYGLVKRMIVVGDRENIFHCLPMVEQYNDWQQLLAKLRLELNQYEVTGV